jgi:uncharacterized protein (TIGR02145 family)
MRFKGIAGMMAGGRGRLWALVWPMVMALVAGLSVEAGAKSSPLQAMTDTVPMPTGQAPGDILRWQGSAWGTASGNPGDVLRMDSLGLLPVWGPPSSSTTAVLGCTDPNACNFNPAAAALLAGSCNYADCQGCTDPAAENYDPSATEDDGSCTFASTCAPVTFDGYAYEVVPIGTQCWFAENLRSDNYRNGDAIPGDLSGTQWAGATSGAQAIYLNDASRLAAYGRLYNWYAVDDARGLCPTGWHMPTDAEWTTLSDFLGGEDVAGHAMKSSPSDAPSWNGSNTSGFSALSGGNRHYFNGNFSNEGSNGYWWSSSPNGSNSAWCRLLLSTADFVLRSHIDLRNGCSVRCVRD